MSKHSIQGSYSSTQCLINTSFNVSQHRFLNFDPYYTRPIPKNTMGSVLSLVCNRQPQTSHSSRIKRTPASNVFVNSPQDQLSNIATSGSDVHVDSGQPNHQTGPISRVVISDQQDHISSPFAAGSLDSSRLAGMLPRNFRDVREQPPADNATTLGVISQNVSGPEIEEIFGLASGGDLARVLMYYNMEIEPNGRRNDRGEPLYSIQLYGLRDSALRRERESIKGMNKLLGFTTGLLSLLVGGERWHN